jgi:hypothetical protein
MKDKARPTRTKGGTDKHRSAAERKADEARSEAERKYHEVDASVLELQRRSSEAFAHVAACEKAYRRAKGLPEERMGGERGILWELMKEVRAQHDAEEAEKKKGEKRKGLVGQESSKDKAGPTRTKGGTDKRRSTAERKADEAVSEALHNLREAVVSADKLQRRVEEAIAHLKACKKACFPEGMMDETDIMAALIEEVDAQREAEEAERKKKEAKAKAKAKAKDR